MEEELKIDFKMDGNQWSCVFTDTFTNLNDSPAGFGFTKKEALEHLLEQVGDDLT